MDYKDAILVNLKAMKKLATDDKEKGKIIAYNRVIKQISEFASPITSMDDLKEVKGIGKGIGEKLEEIFETGKLARAKVVDQELEALVDRFTEIMCIGPVKARELVYEQKLKTIEELREHPEYLNDKQQIGLKYYEDFCKRIPRKEMDAHQTFLAKAMQEISPNIRWEIAGSYRRKAADSGDIDLLVSSTDPEFISEVVQQLGKYVTDVFAQGGTKFMGACKLGRYRTHRRIDIVCIPPEEYAFALLYFTGSQAHNIKMRKQAMTLGYTLNEHGIKPKPTREFTSERDIFEFLQMEYLEPADRK